MLMKSLVPDAVGPTFEKVRPPRVLFVGSYPPRKCGIATFTEDIRGAYDEQNATSSPVIAINDPDGTYDYPSYVIGEIDREDLSSYRRAAAIANASGVDVVNVQHEYGLFGGERGSMLFEFLGALRLPVVLTLHTTLTDPDDTTLRITQALCRRADSVMVLTSSCKNTLASRYGVEPERIGVVMHGVPDVAPYHGLFYKRRLGLDESFVISTFGLLSPGKGIETIIGALPEVVARHPEVTYVLWGQTHPEVRRREGERYRTGLLERARELGVIDNVRFVDRYLSDEEVVSALLATDLYVSPSLDPHQAVSGTLSYALASGRAIIATPYRYARELLADGRGITVPFRDSAALAKAINLVIEDRDVRSLLETAAYRFGRRMTWPKVAADYTRVFLEARSERAPMVAVLSGA
jgi:glycosyltransferase involved in cell wall biosynthesis